MLETAERKWNFVLSEGNRFFILGNWGVSLEPATLEMTIVGYSPEHHWKSGVFAETGYSRVDIIEYSSEHPGKPGFFAEPGCS